MHKLIESEVGIITKPETRLKPLRLLFLPLFVIQFIKVAKCHNKKSEKIMCNKGKKCKNESADVCVAFQSVTWIGT